MIGPTTFFIFFLLIVALVGSLVVLIYAFKPKKKKSSNVITESEIKTFFGDSLLEKAIMNLKQRLEKQFHCRKCNGKKYEIVKFDEDIYETFCLSCGLKGFYNVDLLAGINRSTKRSKSLWPKVWLRDKESTPCPDCKNHQYSDFTVTLGIRYKFTGYGDTKDVTFFLNSCKSCGFINIFDKEAV